MSTWRVKKQGGAQVFKISANPRSSDGAGGQSVFPRMWERMKPLVRVATRCYSDERKSDATMQKFRIISEGACGLATCGSSYRKAGTDPVAIVLVVISIWQNSVSLIAD